MLLAFASDALDLSCCFTNALMSVINGISSHNRTLLSLRASSPRRIFLAQAS